MKLKFLGSFVISLLLTVLFVGVASAQTVLGGDANSDGKVDEADYKIWLGNYRKNVAGGVSQGDFDKNGLVDGVDFVLWRNTFGQTVPTSTATAKPTVSATSTPTIRPTATPITPSPTPIPTTTAAPPPTSSVVGIWTSPDELKQKAVSGDAWNAVTAAYNSLAISPTPDLDNQDDDTNVKVLAAAIVFARTGDSGARNKVVNALRYIETFVPDGRTLAWGRETGAYAMAADLIGYRTAAFEKKMRDMAETYKGSQLGVPLLQMFKQRPNNWGSMAFGSLTAIYRYLGDTTKLKEVRDYMAQSITGPTPGQANYGSLSWQWNESQPRWINPKGATKVCNGLTVNIDGIIPDDMRRGGGCQSDPLSTGYPWEGLQGFLMGVRVLDRAGMSIAAVSDSAVCRAASALQDGRFGSSWRAGGDDAWQLPFWDKICDKSWSASYGTAKWDAGKNAGWGYVIN